jgi:hypothetical protein
MTNETLIDDLIIIGRACPEPIKDGRVTVCLGGYSSALGFVRVYPTRTDMDWKRWDIVRVEVEKDERDTRKESWKIAGSKAEWESLSNKVEFVGKLPQQEWRNLVASLADECVQDINEAQRSLGIVKPTILKRYFAKNPLYGQMFQQALPGFGESTKVKRDFPVEPRVTYTCSTCKNQRPHDQQVLEWGFYEWLRKHPDNIEQVWENAQFDSAKHDIYFFVGNQFNYRNSFMVISTLRVPAGPIQTPLVPYRKWSEE